MKTASVKELRQALTERSPKELLEICLRLSRFKKENKELLTYLLFEASDEMGYVNGVKQLMDEEERYYVTPKSTFVILRRRRLKWSYYCTSAPSYKPLDPPSPETACSRTYTTDSWILSRKD